MLGVGGSGLGWVGLSRALARGGEGRGEGGGDRVG